MTDTLKIGDRVRAHLSGNKYLASRFGWLDGQEGTVIEINGPRSVYVRFDEKVSWFHSCGRDDPYYFNHCWCLRLDELELIDDVTTGYTLDDWEQLLGEEASQ